MKANQANWKNARKIAQEQANESNGLRFVYQELNGSLTVHFDYPKGGAQFETFTPIVNRQDIYANYR